MGKEKLIRKFDKQARIYESRRKKQSEKEWREKLIRCAQGRVLELSVGAGANFPFYPKEVEVTAVDFSREMLTKAKQGAAENEINANFILSDVESLSFPDGSFDTIVSTLSFCGYEDPYSVSSKIHKWCKPDGQILLMEHGISSNRFVGQIQKMMDPMFKKIVGCHLKRDMLEILKKTNLNIRKIERHMLGAIYLVWAAPNQQ